MLRVLSLAICFNHAQEIAAGHVLQPCFECSFQHRICRSWSIFRLWIMVTVHLYLHSQLIRWANNVTDYSYFRIYYVYIVFLVNHQGTVGSQWDLKNTCHSEPLSIGVLIVTSAHSINTVIWESVLVMNLWVIKYIDIIILGRFGRVF